MKTDRTIPNSKLHTIILDNEKDMSVTDIVISGDINVVKKEAQKISKYKDLTAQIHQKWNAMTKVIPVLIGATQTISKSFRKYLSNIPGKDNIKELHT
jgi:hypothetical protein